MKKYNVIELIYKDYDAFLNFAFKLTGERHLAEDVIQDVFTQLLTSNNNHLVFLYTSGKAKSYINKIIAVRCLSKKSKFYKIHIEYSKNKVQIDDRTLEILYNQYNSKSISTSDMFYNKIKKIISIFDEYEKSLFLLYYESGLTFEELSIETGIPKISIYNTVRKVKNKIKDSI